MSRLTTNGDDYSRGELLTNQDVVIHNILVEETMQVEFETLHVLKRKIDELFNSVLGGVELTIEQYILMTVVHKSGRQNPTKIAAELNISKAAVSRRCRELERRRFFERLQPDVEDDCRVIYYTLTREGERLLNKVNGLINEVYQMDTEDDHQLDSDGCIINAIQVVNTMITTNKHAS